MYIQRYALAILYFSTGGPGWLSDLSFLNGEDECKWNDNLNLKWKSGVFCDPATGVVDEISLTNFNIRGKILFRDLSALRNLRQLWIYSDDLFGAFLNFENTLLKTIGLGNNTLMGITPMQIEMMVNLENLELYNNYITS